jgi:hypothetical protein
VPIDPSIFPGRICMYQLPTTSPGATKATYYFIAPTRPESCLTSQSIICLSHPKHPDFDPFPSKPSAYAVLCTNYARYQRQLEYRAQVSRDPTKSLNVFLNAESAIDNSPRTSDLQLSRSSLQSYPEPSIRGERNFNCRTRSRRH